MSERTTTQRLLQEQYKRVRITMRGLRHSDRSHGSVAATAPEDDLVIMVPVSGNTSATPRAAHHSYSGGHMKSAVFQGGQATLSPPPDAKRLTKATLEKFRQLAREKPPAPQVQHPRPAPQEPRTRPKE